MAAGAPSQDGAAPRGPLAGGRQAGGYSDPRICQAGGGGYPSSPCPSSLQRLEALLREQGGLLASLLPAVAPRTNGGEDGRGPAQIVAAGPRTTAGAAEYELLVEAIYEGYLLHYGAPRLLCPTEADLGLLAGDRLYALGLARLVELGDVPAVGELADVITLTALAHGADSPDLADAIWAAGATAVGWGPSEEHARAKALARAGSPDALEAMRAAGKRYS
jgi:hypothetical protein